MKTGYKVSDAMVVELIGTHKDATLRECSKLMVDNKIGSLLILDGKKLIGIISETDFMRFIVEGLDFNSVKVKEVMTKNVITISPNKDIVDAMRLMKQYEIKHLPVVQRGEVVGILTIKDVLRIEPDLFDLLFEKIEISEADKKVFRGKNEGLCEICGTFDSNLKNYRGSWVCNECYEILKERSRLKREKRR